MTSSQRAATLWLAGCLVAGRRKDQGRLAGSLALALVLWLRCSLLVPALALRLSYSLSRSVSLCLSLSRYLAERVPVRHCLMPCAV